MKIIIFCKKKVQNKTNKEATWAHLSRFRCRDQSSKNFDYEAEFGTPFDKIPTMYSTISGVRVSSTVNPTYVPEICDVISWLDNCNVNIWSGSHVIDDAGRDGVPHKFLGALLVHTYILKEYKIFHKTFQL